MRMFGSPVQIGEYVRAVVADEQQITCSVGIGPTKFVAKVACRAAKPDGLIEVGRSGSRNSCSRLPVEAMWGVGQRDRTEAASTRHLHHRRPRTHAERQLAPFLGRTQAACSAIWRGGGTVAASPLWSRSTASARKRRSGGTPTIQTPCAASFQDGGPHRTPDAEAANGGPHDQHLGAVRRLH